MANTNTLVKFLGLDVDETEDEVSSGKCEVYSIIAHNAAATEMYLKLYNAAAASVSVGTTVPEMVIGIGPDRTWSQEFTRPVHFDTGLCVAAVTTAPTAGATGAEANEVVVNIQYKTA